MGTLISNGSSLYRYNSSLLRTPLTVILRPVNYWNAPAGETETLVSGFSMITGAHRSYTGSSDIYDANVDAQIEEIYAMNAVPSYGWVTARQDMGACWYGGGYSTTDRYQTYQGYIINWIARAFSGQGCYQFKIPKGLEKLTLTDLSCSYSGSVAHAFGSCQNRHFGASSARRQFCGLINSSLQIAPRALMSRTLANDIDLSFIARTGSSSSFGVFNYWMFGGTVAPGRDGTIPVSWMSGNADVYQSAVDRIQQIMSAGGNDFYMHIIRPFNITSSGFQPSYAVETPLWWEAQIVNNPVIRMTFE